MDTKTVVNTAEAAIEAVATAINPTVGTLVTVGATLITAITGIIQTAVADKGATSDEIAAKMAKAISEAQSAVLGLSTALAANDAVIDAQVAKLP